MAEHNDHAKQAWHQAQKFRKVLQKELEKLKTESEGNELKRFQALEEVLASFRLHCITTIFNDFEYATTEKVDTNLWQAHSLVNSEFRRVSNGLRGNQHNVLKRTLDKTYVTFLKTAQSFYIAYIQRLAAVFPIPELLRTAESIKAENLNEKNPIANVTPAVRACILKFCHSALIHLGDLSRYRTKARTKVPYEAALTYYSLAHDIIPTSGFGHHQMGIIFLEEKKDLDIIYHFYRSLAIEEPHPMAAQNLEAELKTVQQPSTPARRAGPPDPQEAFILWFVRLHAYFYKGEPFPQHKELEDEVIHRLEMAIKANNTRELLQKMVLLNISAFHYSNRKMSNKWTIAASRYSHFILRLNARFFSTFCKLLKTELDTALEQQAKGEQTLAGAAKTEAEPISLTVQNSLPFVRIYASWLVACRLEILNAQETMGPFVKDMYSGFAKALTSLCEMYGNEDLKLTPYLLSEDQETIGMLPLFDSQLPESCRLHYDEDTQALKPQVAHYKGERFDPRQEAFARALGTIKCGFYLANDDTSFPISFASSPKGLIFTFEESYVPKASAAQVAQPVITDTPARAPTANHAVKRPAQAQIVPSVPNSVAQHMSIIPQQPTLQQPRLQHPTPGRTRAPGQSEYDFSSDTDMLNMVSDFLMPPIANESPLESPEDTSYGMNSAMANEVFAVPSSHSPPAPGSATAKTFPGLPWEMIYTPTPHSKSSELTPPDHAARDAAARRSFDGGAAKRNVQISGTALLEDPFADAQDGALRHHPQRFPGAPDMTAHQDRLLQAFGKPRTESRSMSRDFSGGYGLWPSPHGEANRGNPNALQPRESSLHSRHPSGSRPQLPQSPNVPQVGENFPLSSDTQFSNNSSIYQSTPCNGIAYTATTAFGRGPIAQMQEDPTHYKNLVRSNGGAATDGYTAGYNDIILQSAMEEMRRGSGQNFRH
ncbi:Protein SMG7 [Colletotrichum sidae]|uniref:Nonsense-mediated mRNA decay factor n=1 Tax=Colletotrichum sidae TaxID=1347389 RepID=A0A4R8S9Z0_9PEZI|nr:Protein SMG7 [Colletotrichum sidae]